ncbi:MAG: prolipoprotein diacylglyceryl transferase [Anaerolineae bacterium]|nr:prolipoprotein diacylglyceryl transferase [Anaerolineae bacterium]
MSVIFHILGMIAGGVLSVWRARRAGVELPLARFVLGCIFIIACGIAGARLAYVVADVQYYSANWREIFSIYGTIIPGAIIFGLLALVPVARFVRVPFWKLADLFVPGVALGQAIGRIGCIVEGCCFGLPIRLPGLEQTGWLYPTQAMHGLANLSIALLLLYLDGRYALFEGFLALSYVILFFTQRLLIDFLRDPITSPVFAPTTPLVAGMHVPRVISVAAIVFAAILLAWRWLGKRKDRA